MNTIDKYLVEFQKLETEEEITQFTAKIKKEQSERTEEEKEKINVEFIAGAENAITEAEALIVSINIKEKIEPILPYISISTIAKDYFGKSRNWLYQKLNGNIINGKVAQFTDEEKKTFKFAIEDITKKMQAISTSLG